MTEIFYPIIEIIKPNIKNKLLLNWHRGPREIPLEIPY